MIRYDRIVNGLLLVIATILTIVVIVVNQPNVDSLPVDMYGK